MEGKILSTLGGVYVVHAGGVNYRLFPKGIFRHKKQRLVVGDNVFFNDEDMVIEVIYDRKNELIRPKVANVDTLLITMSVVEPELSVELLYKFLTYANMNGIPASIIFTKTDKLNDFSHLDEVKKDLLKLGYNVYYLSKDKDAELDRLIKDIENKTVVFMGQTGVGKSSAINHIEPNFERKIGEYSLALGRGKHQTKEVVLLPYLNGYIADTPGFSSLELEMSELDVARNFPGMQEESLKCYFPDCKHVSEPKCAVKEKFLQSNIPSIIYESYLKLLEEIKENRHG